VYSICAMSAKKEIRIGVIGAGGRGGLTHCAHNPDDGVRIVAVADVRDAPLRYFRKKYGQDLFTTNDYSDLLKRDDVDVVFVTTPDYLHEEHACAAFDAGKPVYLEKPMAITTEGCDRILDAAAKNGVKLYLGHNMRHLSFVRTMKKMIDEGKIGEVKAGWCRHFVSYGGDAYFRNWNAERRFSNSLLLQKAAHDIDVLHLLCGGYTTRVNAMGGLTVYDRVTDRHPPDEQPDVGANWKPEHWPPLSQKQLHPVMDVEDLSMMQMEMDNGVFACYQQCHYTPDAWRNYTIIGTEGRIENFGDYPRSTIGLWNRRGDNFREQGDEQIEAPAQEGAHGGADPKIVAEFIRYVRQGGEISISPVAARNAVAAGCAATHSLRNGGIPVEVKVRYE